MSPEQRRAMFARRAHEVFPLHGSSGRAKRNRGIALGVGLAAAGAGALYGSRFLPPIVRTPAGFWRNVNGTNWATKFHAHTATRPFTDVEREAMASGGLIGRLVKAQRARHEKDQAYTIPKMAQRMVALRDRARKAAAPMLERASVFNILGRRRSTMKDPVTGMERPIPGDPGESRLLSYLEGLEKRTQVGARKQISKIIRHTLEPKIPARELSAAQRSYIRGNRETLGRHYAAAYDAVRNDAIPITDEMMARAKQMRAKDPFRVFAADQIRELTRAEARNSLKTKYPSLTDRVVNQVFDPMQRAIHRGNMRMNNYLFSKARQMGVPVDDTLPAVFTGSPQRRVVGHLRPTLPRGKRAYFVRAGDELPYPEGTKAMSAADYRAYVRSGRPATTDVDEELP